MRLGLRIRIESASRGIALLLQLGLKAFGLAAFVRVSAKCSKQVVDVAGAMQQDMCA